MESRAEKTTAEEVGEKVGEEDEGEEAGIPLAGNTCLLADIRPKERYYYGSRLQQNIVSTIAYL